MVNDGLLWFSILDIVSIGTLTRPPEPVHYYSQCYINLLLQISCGDCVAGAWVEVLGRESPPLKLFADHFQISLPRVAGLAVFDGINNRSFYDTSKPPVKVVSKK